MRVGEMGITQVSAMRAAKAAGTSSYTRQRTEAGEAKTLRVGQLNAHNLFDTVDDQTSFPDGSTVKDEVLTKVEYEIRLKKVSLAIINAMGAPDIIGLSEIENEKVLADLSKLPEMKKLGYEGVVGSLNDKRGIRVGFLFRKDRVEVASKQEFNLDKELPDYGGGQVDPAKLYARAPLAVTFKLTGAAQAAEGVQQLTVIQNHFKSKLGGAKPEPRRQAQGAELAGFVDALRAADPSTPVFVTGDLNALPEDGAYKKLVFRADGSRRFNDAPDKLKADDRYTYVYRGQKNLLDHFMYSPELEKAVKAVKIPHINTYRGSDAFRDDVTTPDGSSDHDPIVVDIDTRKMFSAK